MVTEENVSFCNCFCSFGIRFYLTPLHKIEMSKLSLRQADWRTIRLAGRKG